MMKSYKEFDEDFYEIVTVSEMEVSCVVNRSRIVLNIPSIKDLIAVYMMYIKFLNDAPKNYNELISEEKQLISGALY